MARSLNICRFCGCETSEANAYASDLRACRECIKTRVRENRESKAAYYRAYDRKRYRDCDHRKEVARKSSRSAAGERSREKSVIRMREDFPEKFVARNAVNNAIRDGKISRQPCYFCNSLDNLHAHHEDYDLPLDVVWLCAPCHGKLHAIKGDFRRAS